MSRTRIINMPKVEEQPIPAETPSAAASTLINFTYNVFRRSSEDPGQDSNQKIIVEDREIIVRRMKDLEKRGHKLTEAKAKLDQERKEFENQKKEFEKKKANFGKRKSVDERIDVQSKRPKRESGSKDSDIALKDVQQFSMSLLHGLKHTLSKKLIDSDCKGNATLHLLKVDILAIHQQGVKHAVGLGLSENDPRLVMADFDDDNGFNPLVAHNAAIEEARRQLGLNKDMLRKISEAIRGEDTTDLI